MTVIKVARVNCFLQHLDSFEDLEFSNCSRLLYICQTNESSWYKIDFSSWTFNCWQKRNDLLKDGNKELTPTAIVEGTTVIRSRRQLSQIIDTTLLKCYLKVVIWCLHFIHRSSALLGHTMSALCELAFLCQYDECHVFCSFWLIVQHILLLPYPQKEFS